MRIQLPTGLTITVSTYEWLFMLEDDQIEDFYKECMADNLGTQIENPFSDHAEKIDLDE